MVVTGRLGVWRGRIVEGEIPERKVAMVRRERRSGGDGEDGSGFCRGGRRWRWRRMIGMGKSGRFVEGLGSGRRRMVGGEAADLAGGLPEMEGMAVRRSGGGGGGGGLRTAASR